MSLSDSLAQVGAPKYEFFQISALHFTQKNQSNMQLLFFRGIFNVFWRFAYYYQQHFLMNEQVCLIYVFVWEESEGWLHPHQ